MPWLECYGIVTMNVCLLAIFNQVIEDMGKSEPSLSKEIKNG